MNNMEKISAQADASMVIVPEHSVGLMEALSGGKVLDIDDYRFYHADDWLIAIGYPLTGRFQRANYANALEKARSETGSRRIFAIAQAMPDSLANYVVERDQYYVLSVNTQIPKRLKNPIKKALDKLTIRQSSTFTAAHRRLWGEFLEANEANMPPRVAALYANTPQALARSAKIRLLDALDANGNIAASLLLDFEPVNFISYILGAHSRQFYIPHAADALFSTLLQLGRQEKKLFIHLGLGVNDGILRFKLKWGAKPGLPFIMAQRDLVKAEAREERVSVALARAILSAPHVSKRELLQNEPSERPFSMLWRLEKKGRVSWIGGTAHFFYHSFAGSFRSLFRHVDNVLFEGPLDPEFMAQVDKAGKITRPGARMIDMLTEREISRLERVVKGPQGVLARMLGLEKQSRADVRWLLANGSPWYSFFTLWTTFLERLGWRQSVDMEAWNIARDMGKNIIAMENLQEQLDSLESLPPERAVNFFRACRDWKRRARQNISAYLAGDLEKMMGSSAEFPTRTEYIVGRRDHRFLTRMRPYLEAGNAAVFVGCAHIVNLRHMLAEDGFNIRHAPFGILPRLHRAWRLACRPDKDIRW